jgi:hypothetical protein
VKIIKPAFLLSSVALIFVACASNLKPLNVEVTRSLLPWLDDQMTKAEIIEKLGRSWLYSEKSGRVLVYSMVEQSGAIVVSAPGDAPATHELVLIYDQHYRLQRYSLIKVK